MGHLRPTIISSGRGQHPQQVASCVLEGWSHFISSDARQEWDFTGTAELDQQAIFSNARSTSGGFAGPVAFERTVSTDGRVLTELSTGASFTAHPVVVPPSYARNRSRPFDCSAWSRPWGEDESCHETFLHDEHGVTGFVRFGP